MPTTLVSGFLHTDAMNFVDCPECHQPAKSCCVTHKGKRLRIQHTSRVDAYLKKFPDRVKLYEEGPDRMDRTRLYNQRMQAKPPKKS